MDRYQALSKEIVHYIQTFGNDTKQCLEFVEYELRLRFVSKDDLANLSIQKDINARIGTIDYSIKPNLKEAQ